VYFRRCICESRYNGRNSSRAGNLNAPLEYVPRVPFLTLETVVSEHSDMMTRTAKFVLVAAVAVYCGVVVFNNVTDFNSNYAFVHHVLRMDSTLPGNHGMWRAITSPQVHMLFYLSIIGWEAIAGLLLLVGALRLFAARRAPIVAFDQAKRLAVAGLTLALLMWLFAFLTVGGEWFLMWQSQQWNGQQAAFRMFTVVGIVLLLVNQPERETQP